MRRHTWPAILATLLAFNCGPPQPGTEHKADCRPYDVTAEAGDAEMTVTWKVDCPNTISGYNIYITPIPRGLDPSQSLPRTATPFNTTVYPGDTNPDDDIVTYDARGLVNGVHYVVAVSVVFPDGSFSPRSGGPFVVCGPRGEIELDTRYRSDQDGFSFSEGKYVRADDLSNDLYFYSKDGVHYLASPTRLDGFLRKSLFKRVSGEGSSAARPFDVSPATTPTEERVSVNEGDWVWIITDDGSQAWVEVRELSIDGDIGRARLYYIYWPNETAPAPQ